MQFIDLNVLEVRLQKYHQYNNIIILCIIIQFFIIFLQNSENILISTPINTNNNNNNMANTTARKVGKLNNIIFSKRIETATYLFIILSISICLQIPKRKISLNNTADSVPKSTKVM